jgi:hypothetical protein
LKKLQDEPRAVDFSSDQGAEKERGGVAALRRTSDDEGNAELA